MKEKELSIIIPVYNAEDSLDRMFASLEEKNDDTEILLINDGSTDSSEKKCRDFADHVKDVSLISKENGGVSAARNEGMQASSGKWIMFLDADDYLLSEWNKTVQEAMCQHKDADIILFSDALKKERLDGRFCAESALGWGHAAEAEGHSFGYPVSKLYSRRIVEEAGLSFEPGLINGEDMLFNAEAYLSSKQIACVGEPVYAYCKNMSSATNRFNPQIIETERRFHEKLKEIMAKYHLESDNIWKQIYKKSLLTGIYSLFYRIAMVQDTAAWDEILGIVQQDEYQSALHHLSDYRQYLSKQQRLLLSLVKSRHYSAAKMVAKAVLFGKKLYYRKKADTCIEIV